MTPNMNTLAVVKAALIACVINFAFGVVFGVLLFRFLPDDLSIEDSFEIPTILYWIFFLLSLFPNLLGGYLAATYAGRNFLLHAIVTGTVLLAAYAALYLIPSEDDFSFMDGITLLAIIPLAATGGCLARKVKKLSRTEGSLKTKDRGG